MSRSAVLQSDLEQHSSSVGWLASYRNGRPRHEQELLLVGNLGQPLPAKAEDASGSVIFDGVLYNRADLSKYSSDSPTENDAAIVLKAYRRWGEDLLHKIKGIFALIIQDRERDVLLGARDPVGVYPLFYACIDGEWLFSTSVEALTRHPRVSAEVNRAALVDHLCHGWPDIEETVFKNVKRVPPGHIMRVARAKQVSRYWEPPIPGAGVDWVREDELGRFDELLDQAVERCLCLGPAAIYLSGGLDSVSVAAVAAENSRRKGLLPPLALSLGFPAECDEEKIQRSVAADLGLPQVFMTIGDAIGPDGLLLSALKMTSHWPMPMLNLWNPAYHRLGLEAKHKGCKAILTGGGGDEWLGVTPFLAADLMRTLNVVGLYQLWSTMQRSFPVPWHLMIKNALWTFGARPLLGEAKRATIGRILRSAAPGLLQARQKRRMQRTIPDWVAPDPALREHIDQRLQKSLEQTKPVRAKGGFYFRELWRSLDHVLTAMEMEEVFESGTRMGLPILMPYWDADLLEMLYRVPPHLLNKGGRSKALVRQSLARKFPELGFDQQKKIVTINFFDSTLLRDGKKAWQVMGGTPALVKLGIVDEERLASTIADLLTGGQPRQAYRIWDVLNLEAWLRPRL
jgi:asparagine synthase (glutamine-hydrolysing)